MALKKKTKPVDVKTDEEKSPEVNSAPANEAAPTQESEAAEAAQVEVANTETEVEAAVEQASDSTEVSTSAQSTSVATTPGGGNFSDQAAEEGFEGVELGYFSFPSIKLPSDGVFETNGKVVLGKFVDVIVTQSKAKYLIKPAGAIQKDKRVNFSYDVMKEDSGVSLEGNTVPQLKKEWGVDSLEIKKYLEIPAMLVGADHTEELNGEMVMLSVPPSGVQRFSGHLAMLKFTGKGSPKEVVTRCAVGAKVSNNGDDFYPWEFKYLRAA